MKCLIFIISIFLGTHGLILVGKRNNKQIIWAGKAVISTLKIVKHEKGTERQIRGRDYS